MADEPRPVRVMFLGDSFVLGSGDDECLGWVGRVSAASRRRGIDLTAYNLGVGGETSAEIAARWRAEVTPRLSPDAESRAVISMGANDILTSDAHRRLSLAQSRECLRAMLSEAARLRPLVVGPPALAEPADHESLLALSRAFEEDCAEAGVPFIATGEALAATPRWLPEALGGDGLHTNAGGYAEMAELVLEGGWWEWLAG
jgi:lysophospholipase L1-like esterase